MSYSLQDSVHAQASQEAANLASGLASQNGPQAFVAQSMNGKLATDHGEQDTLVFLEEEIEPAPGAIVGIAHRAADPVDVVPLGGCHPPASR